MNFMENHIIESIDRYSKQRKLHLDRLSEYQDILKNGIKNNYGPEALSLASSAVEREKVLVEAYGDFLGTLGNLKIYSQTFE